MDKNTVKKRQRLLLLFIIVFVLVMSGLMYGYKLYVDSLNIPEKTSASQQSSEVQTTQTLIDNPIDFNSLQRKNNEIYAWIKVDGTKVDYPIVQSRSDDSFYLKHTAEDKSWSASGAVYTELANNHSFTDPVTLIYGHNGYGDTFFTTLHYFEKTEFFNSHEYFYIYTPRHKLTYQIISAFKYDDRHILNSFDFRDDKVFTDFQKEISNPVSALVNTRSELETELNADSKIVILSTCITYQKSSRYLVCGVLTKDEKTN